MHEWALAEAVIETVEKTCRENGEAVVTGVDVQIGELQSIEMDVFKEGLKAFLPEYPFDLEVFHFHIEKANFSCNQCRKEWLLDDHEAIGEEELEAIHFLPETAHVYMRCPFCGSPDFTLQKGRGVSISSIELNESVK